MKYSERLLPIIYTVEVMEYKSIDDLIELQNLIEGVISVLQLTASNDDEQFVKTNDLYQERFSTTASFINKYSQENDSQQELQDRFNTGRSSLVTDLKEAESKFRFFKF